MVPPSVCCMLSEPQSGSRSAITHGTINVNQATKDASASPLYIACQNNHEALVELLAHDEVNVNQASTKDGMTRLFIACQNNHRAVVERLLAHDAIDVSSEGK